MQLAFFVVDSFTSQKFKGNPTAVCVTEKELPGEIMLSVAKEFQFPVTTFIQKKATAHYTIKYFTPTTAIPACGHATLAAAAVVCKETTTTRATFETTENILLDVELKEDTITMTYPKYEMATLIAPLKILEALGLQNYASAGLCKELETLFIEIADPVILKNLLPDYKMLIESSDHIKEVVVTSLSDDPKYDFILRSFCPWIGIDEDPVTGSVHSVLANFWKDRLGKNTLTAYQASERGGEIFVTAFDDKVELGGKTITILKGELSI